MFELDSRYVKKGFWINNDLNSPLSSTITTDSQTGTIIVALLAVLSTLATTHFWSLLLFFTHQARAHGRPADALFRQQQALLRSSPPPTTFLVVWSKLYWTWRKRTNRAVYLSIALFIFAFTFAILSILAGIFSSYVLATTNIPVLVNSKSCGPLNIEPTVDGFSYAYLDKLGEYTDTVAFRSVSYARDCYQNTTDLPIRCQAFIKPSIKVVPNREQCPFQQSVCTNITNPAVSIDSGLVNTNEIFGWNMNTRDHVKYRRKLTCAVLDLQSHIAVVEVSAFPFSNRPWVPGEKYVKVLFGGNRRGKYANVTLSQSTATANITTSYSIGKHRLGMEWTPVNGLLAMPDWTSNDSDITFIGIGSNQVAYYNPVDDPIFSAHRPYLWNAASNDDTPTLYFGDQPMSVLGCRQQFQLCYTMDDHREFCTQLSGLPGKVDRKSYPGASEIQLAALQLLITSSFQLDVGEASSSVFEAQDLAERGAGRVISLPDDQWIREVVGWEKYIWAAMQTMITDYAIGFGNQVPSVTSYIRSNLTVGEKQLCGAQRMVKPGGFVNINVFGLSLIIGFTSLVTILDLAALKIFVFFSRFRRALAPRIERWVQDGVFHLQRRAYEGNQYGNWELLDRDVPVTVPSELLPELPLKIRCPTCLTHNKGQTPGSQNMELQPVASPNGKDLSNSQMRSDIESEVASMHSGPDSISTRETS